MMRDTRGDTLKEIYSLFVFNSIGALDIFACLSVAITIQNKTFSNGIVDYIVANQIISAENVSLVQQLDENMMDDIIQFGPFTEKERLLLLIAWFDNSSEKKYSKANYE